MIEILSYKDFKAGISNTSVQLIDVRSAMEFQAGTIAHAVSLDVQSSEFSKRAKEQLKFDQPIYLFCRSGMRSQLAARLLESIGAEQVYDLNGGYSSWKNHQ